MADNDDDTPDNVVPFGRAAVAELQPTNKLVDIDAEAFLARVKEYDTVVLVGYSDESGVLDVISEESDNAALYELLQQAASNIAFQALDNADASTFH